VYTLAEECYIVPRTVSTRKLVSSCRRGVVRYLALISLTVFFASALVVLVDRRTEPALAAAAVRGPDQMLGAPRYSQTTVESYARSIDCSRYIMKAIPIYYRVAPRMNIAPEVLVAQAIVETGRGYYGGVSKPWNMAGIKKGGANRGDDPEDFEVPPSAYEGVRMHVNHMAAYTGKRFIGEPHDRFYDARTAQKQRGWWVRRISQLGDGIWAEDPTYASKIRTHLDNIGRR
jgi:Mannosyl-glycoprotein endo-beta-N-acetylglucosaminidase